MPRVPGLRSPYARVGRLVLFGRVLDKIRLHAAGRLPPEYVRNLGEGHPLFADGRVCRFLGVRYENLRAQALATMDDAAVLAWAEATGTRRTDEECEVWNDYVIKLGWRDRAADRLRQRAAEAGLGSLPIATLPDLMDYEEGRDPVTRRAWEPRPTIVVVLMGVAGSGKTTVGTLLARQLGWEFRDADEFHPPANIAKMSAGTPLDDADRAPWLAAIRAYIDECVRMGDSAVVTCSALRARYRDVLTSGRPEARIVHLAGDFALIRERLNQREGHFMNPALLQSQFDTLETPENALQLDVAQPPEALVAEIRHTLAL